MVRREEMAVEGESSCLVKSSQDRQTDRQEVAVAVKMKMKIEMEEVI